MNSEDEGKARILAVGGDFRALEARMLAQLLSRDWPAHKEVTIRDHSLDALFIGYDIAGLTVIEHKTRPAYQVIKPKPKHNNGKGPRDKWGKLK